MEPQNTSPSVSVAAAPRLPSFSQLWKESWNILKGKFKTYITIMALPLATQIVAALLTLGLVSEEPGTMIGAGLLLFVISIANIVLSVIATGAVAHISVRSEETIAPGAALREGRARFWSIVWVGFLSGILSFVGFFFFIVPGILLSISFSFGIYVLMLEGDRGMQALLKSREYIKGNMGKLFGNTLLLGLILGAITMIITVIFQIIDPTLGSIVQALLTAVITPFSVIFASRFYIHSKQLKGVPSAEAVAANWASVRTILWGGCAVAVVMTILIVFLATR